MPEWMEGLTHKDWLFDGHPIRSPVALERFGLLQWDKAWVDLGPSVAGNPGPYWHVPLHWDDDDTVHRLYPKVVLSKWLGIIRRACEECTERADPDRLRDENRQLHIDLATAKIRIRELEMASRVTNGERQSG